MSKKAAKKAQIEAEKAQGDSILQSFVIPFVVSLVITGFVCTCITYLMGAAYDMGTVFTLASALVLALCHKKGAVSMKTTVTISILMGIFIGLFMGAFHIGYFFATHDGSLALFESSGIKAVHMSSRFEIVATVRAFLMHLFFNTKYGMVFNISLAGIFDLFISIAFYLYFMVFMAKRLRR